MLLLHLLKKVLRRETIALDVGVGMLECETTDADEPLSISTVARASNWIQRSFVTVTVDTTRRHCGRVFSCDLQSHSGGLGSVCRSVVSQPHISACLSRRQLFIQTFQGHIETMLLQMCTSHHLRVVIRLHLVFSNVSIQNVVPVFGLFTD